MAESIDKFFKIWEDVLVEQAKKVNPSDFASRMRNPTDNPSILGGDMEQNKPTRNFTSGPELEMVAKLKIQIEELEKLAHAQFLDGASKDNIGKSDDKSSKTMELIKKMKDACDDLSTRFPDQSMNILPPELKKQGSGL